jgi:pteridine reductase
MSVAMTDHNPQRVALVTGGAIRVGRAITLALASAGYDVMISYRSSTVPAEETRAAVESLGQRCEVLIDKVRDTFGRLDLLVNSAASFDKRGLLELDAEMWDTVMNLNARAPHLLVRAAADLLQEARGSVVNIVDLSAFQPWADYPAHSVAKAALAHLTRIQARALAPEIRVNAIAPGAVLPPDNWPTERWHSLAQITPLQRVGSPEDVAQAVLFFAGAEFVTGQILAVDGGRLLGPVGPPPA